MQIFGGWGKSTSTSGAAAGAPSAIVTTSSGHVSSNAPADQGVSDAEVAKIFKRDIKSFAESSGLPMKTPDQKKIVGAMFMKFIDEKRRDAAIAQQSKYVQGAHNLAQDAQDLATFQFKEVLAAQTLLCEMRDERNAQRRLAQQPSALDINEACAETPAEYAEMLLARHFQDELVDAEVFLDGVIDQLKTQSLPEHGLEIAAEGEACRTLLKSGNPEKIDEVRRQRSADRGGGAGAAGAAAR
ncbi:hypothetical protein M885DRAFT_539588 [Pelagophyceae sp. CCMP2097]|nr:hypothetical protein M885DRAFT_539588 [Pelagophyceae sp. CCMP2097]